MADERDFELLDDYLTHRMREEDRAAFEQKLQADPDLHHEYALQKRMIKGIKEARAAELKAMLDKVPVPPGGTGNTVATRIILGTVVSLVIAAAGYWYFNQEDQNRPTPKTTVKEEQKQPESETPATSEAESDDRTTRDQPAVPVQPRAESDKNQTSAGTEHSKPSLAKKPGPLQTPDEPGEEDSPDGPVLDVFNPDPEETRNTGIKLNKGDETLAARGNSSIVVETDRENRRYSFHYQFREGKLFLFGPFEQNLYEIMEFFADDKRTVFLYYNDRYYLLEEASDEVRPLTPITDPALLKKLVEYRTSK